MAWEMNIEDKIQLLPPSNQSFQRLVMRWEDNVKNNYMS